MLSAQEQDYIHSVTTPDYGTPVKKSGDDVFASTITPELLKKHLYTIASDEFQGRGLGEPGIDLAADYITTELKKAGVKSYTEGNYYQPIAITFSGWTKNTLKVNGEKHRHLWDYLAFPDANTVDAGFEADEIVFLGYGIEDKKFNDYKKTDVVGKVIMIYKGEPKRKNGKYWVSGDKKTESWDIARKLKVAKKNGVKAVLIIDEDIKENLGNNRAKILGSIPTLGNSADENIEGANHIYISSTLAKKILGDYTKKVAKSRKKSRCRPRFKAVTVPVNIKLDAVKRQTIFEGKNILAFIPGSDASLSKEIVVLSAHYDHLGQRGDAIYNGADDNGSGTTTILSIASALQKAHDAGKGSKRPVAIMFLTGEEKGLLGSSYFVNKPVIPLKDIMVDVNVDMVGRVDEKYEKNPKYIYVIGSDRLSTDLHKINEKVNEDYSKLVMDYTYNSEKDPNRYYYRSDHYNFASNGIPAIFFFNGVHEDYHMVTDTPDKINYDKMSKVGQHIFRLVRTLANQDKRINVDGVVK